MRCSAFSSALVTVTLAASVTAQLIAITSPRSLRDQEPLNLGPAMPPTGDPPPPPTGDVILSDVLGLDRTINVFAGFARDIDTVSNRLNNQGENTTVLAPLNSAIVKLPRKPWEDSEDYDTLGENAYAGDDGIDRAHRNLKRFVESHVVGESPWAADTKLTTMAGQEVWWEDRDGVKFLQPGDIEISSVAKTVANGEVWIIKACRPTS